MSQVWYVKQGDTILGPMPAGELKKLAQDSKIDGETAVRLGDEGDWFEARKVKGLFSAPPTSPQPAPLETSGPPVPDGHSDSPSQEARQPQAAPINPYQAPTVLETSQAAPLVGNPAELKATRTGLLTVYYGICSVLLGIIGGMVVVTVGAVTDITPLAIVGAILIIGGGVGGSIAILVGQIFCLTVPAASGAKGFVQASVALQVFAILIGFGVPIMVGLFGSAITPSPIIEIGANVFGLVNAVLGLASFVCFLLFLKNLGLFLQRTDLSSRASTTLKLVMSLVVAYFVVVGLAIVPAIFGAASAFVGILLAVLMLGILLLGLITFIRYANLVVHVARAIPRT